MGAGNTSCPHYRTAAASGRGAGASTRCPHPSRAAAERPQPRGALLWGPEPRSDPLHPLTALPPLRTRSTTPPPAAAAATHAQRRARAKMAAGSAARWLGAAAGAARGCAQGPGPGRGRERGALRLPLLWLLRGLGPAPGPAARRPSLLGAGLWAAGEAGSGA